MFAGLCQPRVAVGWPRPVARKPRASQIFSGGLWQMNRSKDTQATLASGTLQHIQSPGTVFILHLPQWN